MVHEGPGGPGVPEFSRERGEAYQCWGGGAVDEDAVAGLEAAEEVRGGGSSLGLTVVDASFAA